MAELKMEIKVSELEPFKQLIYDLSDLSMTNEEVRAILGRFMVSCIEKRGDNE